MGQEDLAIKSQLQQSAPSNINSQKAVSSKIMMNTNDLFDNVLNMDEEEERRQNDTALSQINQRDSTIAQQMKKGDEGRKDVAMKPMIKAILKTKTMGSMRFNTIAA